ncbi:MAG: polyphosphate polymerase domain-containing protein [Eubacteriales bacterium]|nr:polyphosphate polymerase domain-containing protein [Eubacteriales bacterium]
MNEVMRNERKFLLPLDEYYRLSSYFSKFLIQDEHNGRDGYTVRSLYFDTPYERDFYEKEDGVETRRKIRLRIYSPKDSFGVLEMKQKQGTNQLKRSLRIFREDAEKLAQGRYDVLLKYSEDFAAECFGVMQMHAYQPKSIIEYRRKAFIAKENRIRLTFDHHITASESNTHIFSENPGMNSVCDPYLVVFEVKYNGFLLSYIRDAINYCEKSETSVSKYCLGRSVSLHYLF